MITILFYPEPLKPKPLSRVYRVLKEQGTKNGITYHNDPTKPYDLHIFWSYTKDRIKPNELTLIDKAVINRGCWEVGKEKVNNIFNDIRIDPTTYKGVCVKKLDKQGSHKNHSLITCPDIREEGFVYQKYIDDKEGDQFVKYRVYYADGIQVILKSYKPTIFGSECTKHEIVAKRQLFSPEAEAKFILKCMAFGLDFGEIDIMMDEGIPIIVDVNNCVGGGFVWGLTGTDIHKKIDNTFITFIKQRYDKSSKVQQECKVF